MGIPEPWLNKAAHIAKFAINIKNLRRSCKIASGAPDDVRSPSEKRVTSRKNNSPGRSEDVSTRGAVHENRGHGWPLLEAGGKRPVHSFSTRLEAIQDGSRKSQILPILDVGRPSLRRIDIARRGIERRAPEILRTDADLAAPRSAPRNTEIERRPFFANEQRIVAVQHVPDDRAAQRTGIESEAQRKLIDVDARQRRAERAVRKCVAASI